MGKILILLGIVLIVLGLAWEGVLGWLGRLPGDIVWQGERFTIFIPLTSSLLLSLFLSAALWLLSRWW